MRLIAKRGGKSLIDIGRRSDGLRGSICEGSAEMFGVRVSRDTNPRYTGCVGKERLCIESTFNLTKEKITLINMTI